MPAIDDLLSGRVSISNLRKVELEDLLGREVVRRDSDGLHRLLGGRTGRVTGAGGSIGAELARQIKVPTNRVTQILNGQRSVTGDTALRLGHFLGTSAEFWLNLQMLYDLRVAERDSGCTVRSLPTLAAS